MFSGTLRIWPASTMNTLRMARVREPVFRGARKHETYRRLINRAHTANVRPHVVITWLPNYRSTDRPTGRGKDRPFYRDVSKHQRILGTLCKAVSGAHLVKSLTYGRTDRRMNERTDKRMDRSADARTDAYVRADPLVRCEVNLDRNSRGQNVATNQKTVVTVWKIELPKWHDKIHHDMIRDVTKSISLVIFRCVLASL